MKLEGLRVVDLSLFLPGPAMTQMMADHGAEVIKVEPPGGEPNREIGLKQGGVSVYFASTHRGKKSFCVNLKHEAGVEALLRLADTADVFVEAFRPGVAARLGIGSDMVRARNRRIIYASLSAYGQTGPYAGRAAHDPAVQAMAGTLSVNEGMDGKPTMAGVAVADMLVAQMGLAGIMMALYRREKTGEGDTLDLAMMDALLAAIPNNLGPPMVEKRPPVVKDERIWGGQAMLNIYETEDGRFIVLGGAEIKFAANLLNAFDRPDLIELCKLPPGKPQAPVRAFLKDLFLTRTQAEWIAWMADKDIAFAPVQNLREALDDPQARARDMVVEDERGFEHIGNPLKFTGEPPVPDFSTAAIGQHSIALLEELGYASAEIERLARAGTIIHPS
ncbi:MAG: CaiB/BaiF CoA-transferase family protein [Alphaproteobacteria bacterium]